MEDDQADIFGVWNGSAPTCERKQFAFVMLLSTYVLNTWLNVHQTFSTFIRSAHGQTVRISRK